MEGGPPTYLSIYGTLFHVGSMVSVRIEGRSTVRDLVAVAAHWISTAVELGDLQIAVDQGPHVDSSTLSLERRVRHSLEVVRAYSAQDRMDEALALVLDAEELALE
ncbi:hypothetical protein ACIRS1_08635 [Kitasatospora sp. NPDC101176]|uniref:hypothetical protein n=1 Tax=Kitasatospora sp. NPDC101176 TaxID=3364099 RepID=UPI0037FEE0A9